MKRNFSLGVLLAALVALALPTSAFAQAGAACPIATQSPVVSAASTYTLKASDNCKTLVFTAASVAITMPNAPVTFPPGWRVWLKATGANGIYTTPTTSLLDGASSQLHITQGFGCQLNSDAVNMYSIGCGVAHP
jgi:hypothetical protein